MTTREALTVSALVVVGGSAGFLAGLLVAPQSGRDTRKQLTRRLEDGRDDLVRRGRHAAKRMSETLEGGVERGRRAISEVMKG